MRSSKSRSRNKSRNQRSLGNVVNRVFDSSGPEGKVRGTPQQIIEKYLALARDAQLSNDRVAEQSFLQHAEHYTRMLGEAQREQAERQGQMVNGNGDDRDDRQPGAERPFNERRDENRRDEGRRDEGRRDESRRDESRRDDARRDDRGEQRTENRRDDRRDDRVERRERPVRDQQSAPADPQPEGYHDALPDFLRAPAPAEGIPEAVALNDAGPVETPEALSAEVADQGAEPAGEADAPRTRRRAAAPRKAATPRKRAAAAEDAPDDATEQPGTGTDD